MAICRNPNCGKENPDNNVFCKYCGRRLKELKNSNKKPIIILIGAAALIVILIFIKVLFGVDGQKQAKVPNNNKSKVAQNKDNGKGTDLSKNYSFVFVRGQGNMKEIYLNNNGAIAKVTNSNAVNQYPCWSPDKSKIVFERKEGKISNIYCINSDGTGEKKLAEGYEPTWSSDGTKILFYNKDPKSISNILYSMNPDGTGIIEKTTTKDSYYMGRYSPDGSKIALAKSSIAGSGIYIVRPDMTGSNEMSLSQKREDEPAWSPDGNKVAFVSQRDGNPEIYIVDMNKNISRLTNNLAADHSPYFTPDGRIIFTRDEVNSSNLYIIDSDGKNEAILLKDALFGAAVSK